MSHRRVGRILLSLAICAGGAGWLPAAEPSEVPLTRRSRIVDSRIVPWVKLRVRERQPTAAERRFDQIGWASDLRAAMRLAKQHKRPLFLFTHDGRMNVGRC